MLALRLTARERNKRRGVAVVEMAIILPIVLLMIFGMAGLADLLVTEQLLSEASGRAARTAALGGTDEQVKAAVAATLGPQRAQHVAIYVGAADGSKGPVPPGGLIEVRLEVKAGDATATRLFPIRADEVLVGRTVMQKE